MVADLAVRLPRTKFLCVGFSMGGNLVTKYLGEAPRDERLIAGISVCQGYEANEYAWRAHVDPLTIHKGTTTKTFLFSGRRARCSSGKAGAGSTFTS